MLLNCNKTRAVFVVEFVFLLAFLTQAHYITVCMLNALIRGTGRSIAHWK